MTATITPGPTHGVDGVVFIDGIDFSSQESEFSVSASAAAADRSTMGIAGNWRQFLGGLKGWVANLSALYFGQSASPTGLSGEEILLDNVNAQVGAWMFGFHGDEIGRYAAFGEFAFVLSADANTPVEDISSLVAVLTGNNQAESGQIHQVKEAITAFPQEEESIDLGAVSTLFGGTGFIHHFAQAGGTSVAPVIQDSADDAAWADLVTFPVKNTAAFAAGSAVVRLGVAATVRRHTRFEMSEVGGVTSATVAAGFVRNLTDQS